MKASPRRGVRYSVAVLVTAAMSLFAAGIRILLEPDHPGQVSSPLLLMGVLISAWQGGTGAGLLAAILSFFSLEYFFMPPLLAFGLRVADMPRAFAFLLAATAISVINTQRQRVEQKLHKTEKAISAARAIQERFLPASSPSLSGFDMAGASYPAEATGGDYFDYIPMRGGLGIVVADVSGHGLDAALLMAEARAYLRALVLMNDRVDEILSLTNAILFKDTDAGRFVTLFFLYLDPPGRSFVYAGAGHEAYLLRASGARVRLDSTSLPLGLAEDLTVPVEPAIQLARGDVIVLATDGVAEARSQGKLYGVDRINDFVFAHRDKPAREIVDLLLASVQELLQGSEPEDDMTIVIVKVH